MEYSILLYASVDGINVLTNAFLILLNAALSMRAMRDFMAAYDEENGFKIAANKVKKRIFAAVIALCTTGLVAFVRKFY